MCVAIGYSRLGLLVCVDRQPIWDIVVTVNNRVPKATVFPVMDCADQRHNGSSDVLAMNQDILDGV